MSSYKYNGTKDPQNDDVPSYQIILPAIAVTIVIIAIIFGNSLVCIAIWKVRSLKSIQNWFLFSLAVSDLMVGVLIMPFGIVNKLLGYWLFGSLWCQIWKCLDVNACSASILNLCLISVDRYFSIIKAVKYNHWRNAFRAKVMIASVWILSALISLPPLFGWQGDNDGGERICSLSDNNAYIIYSTMCSFFIPAFIMVYIYIRIWFAAKKHARTSIRKSSEKVKKKKKGKYELTTNVDNTCVENLEPSGGSDEAEPPSSPQESSQNDNEKDSGQKQPDSSPKWEWHKHEEETPVLNNANKQKETKAIGDDKTALVVTKDKNGVARENGKLLAKETENERQKRKLAQARERRATLVLGIIMGGFILSWYPFFQLYFITAICDKCRFPDLLFLFFEWIGYCNSAINPLIYTFFNRDFRKAFKKLLGCGR
ncbi:alpha-2A adrenergic receptor-like [Anneissia japonica]|uniref:alpha-2A adrenergic receptor-like n=1 Tax=Anneissia japonica TaxID=1529436 RepID=UPI0014255060|nr:alpha-2A adrenergic receptor-like [Anneissia japonica]XP_033122467.1 alpha-2A adrenergic receptor-like [Anneissia japonica]